MPIRRACWPMLSSLHVLWPFFQPPYRLRNKVLLVLGMIKSMGYFASTPKANSKGLNFVVECFVEL